MAPYQRVDKGCGHGHTEPDEEQPDEGGDVLPDDVLDHPALQPRHVDGEEGAGHQHHRVPAQQPRLAAPQPRHHDLNMDTRVVQSKSPYLPLKAS